MTNREKLIELIANCNYIDTSVDGDKYSITFDMNILADHLIANGVTVQETAKKAEDCRFHTTNCIWGAGCLGTKEIDPCKGDKCESWKPKEETQ